MLILGILAVCLAVQIAVAENTSVGDKPPNVDAASVKSATPAASKKIIGNSSRRLASRP